MVLIGGIPCDLCCSEHAKGGGVPQFFKDENALRRHKRIRHGVGRTRRITSIYIEMAHLKWISESFGTNERSNIVNHALKEYKERHAHD
jgi:hypothetical protein